MSDRAHRAQAVSELLSDLSFAAVLAVSPEHVRDAVAHVLSPVAGKKAINEAVKAFRQRLAQKRQSASGESEPVPKHSYSEKGGCICRLDLAGNATPLTNFSALIVENVSLDLGTGPGELWFRIEGTLADGTKLPRIDVAASEYADMNWVPALWGSRPIIIAGRGVKDQVREALQELSHDTVETRRRYGHLGWMTIDGKRCFLHAQGAVGADGIEVFAPGQLARFRLPEKVDDVVGAVRLSLRLLDCAPLSISAPIFAAVYLAPLASIVGVNTTLFLKGPSGRYKSTLAAIAQAHFGDFDLKSLPANFEGTANAIEKFLFLTKDMLVVLDDFAPKSSPWAQRNMEAMGQRVVRSVGNQSGRARMDRDTNLRVDYAPRAMVLATGEDLPPGLSILGRLFAVEVPEGAVRLDVVTEIQDAARLLPQALRAYVEHLRVDKDLDADSHELLREFRKRAGTELGHSRAPDNIAYLALGITAGLNFAVRAGALTVEAADKLETDCWNALLANARLQAVDLRETDPAIIFMSTLRTLLAQGRIYLQKMHSTDKSLPHRFGPPGATPNAVKVGWRDQHYGYLLPDAAREEVLKSLRAADRAFSLSAKSLNQALLEAGFLVRHKSKKKREAGRLDPQLRFGADGRHRVQRIRLSSLIGAGGSDDETTGVGTGATGSNEKSVGSTEASPLAPDPSKRIP